MHPINSIKECSTAFRAISSLDLTAYEISQSPRPEGCYENIEYGRAYLAVNPKNQGNGADSTHHPICKAIGVLHTSYIMLNSEISKNCD